MIRWLQRILVGVVGVAVLAYGMDWAVLRVRVARGGGFGSVEVSQFMATPLKSGKAEYDFLGQAMVPCTRSLFPQILIPQTNANEPCWWVERHTSEWVMN